MMILVPELGVVLAHRAMLQEMRGGLSIGGAQPTYNLGDFCVTPSLPAHIAIGSTCNASCLSHS